MNRRNNPISESQPKTLTEGQIQRGNKYAQVYLVLSAIPKGQVATYSQVAQLSGIPNGARQVARALRTLPTGSNIPWFRVINAQGRISIPGAAALRQKEHLENEGICFLKGRVNLKDYQWKP